VKIHVQEIWPLMMGTYVVDSQSWTSPEKTTSSVNAHVWHSESRISLTSFANVLRTTALKRSCQRYSTLHGYVYMMHMS
jgi:hypothetical protein